MVYVNLCHVEDKKIPILGKPNLKVDLITSIEKRNNISYTPLLEHLDETEGEV